MTTPYTTSRKKNHRYLTGPVAGTSYFVSKFAAELAKSQKRAPAAQWIELINGLKKRGVKETEINESGILTWLGSKPPKEPVFQTELLATLAKMQPIIKELDLIGKDAPFIKYRVKGTKEKSYLESLLILQSEKLMYQDRLDDIRFEIEELDFNPELLADDPEAALRLYEEQQEILALSSKSEDFTAHHHSSVTDPITGKKVINLLVHARVSIIDDIFFIHEIQSDWAQRLRRRGEQRGLPDGPFVTNTELWTNLALRRLLQRAAEDSQVNRVAWITSGLRNGGNFGDGDNLKEYYEKIIPKLVDKIVSGTGTKSAFAELDLGENIVTVPSLELNDAARKKLTEAQPLYSLDLAKEASYEARPRQREQVLDQELDYALAEEKAKRSKPIQDALRDAREMLGSSMSIRLANQVFDALTGEEVAGKQVGHLIEVSLQARNPSQVIPHECWHYAYEHLLGPVDKGIVDDAFADGSYLNQKVRMALVKDGASEAAISQCADPREAAAHAFSLWAKGKMEISLSQERANEPRSGSVFDRLVIGLFKKVEGAFMGLSRWVQRKVGESAKNHEIRRVEQVFDALKSGLYADALERNRTESWADMAASGEEFEDGDEVEVLVRPRMRG